MKNLNLEKITWENGKFLDEKKNQVKVVPIGIPQGGFWSMWSASMDHKEIMNHEKEEMKKQLEHLRKEDKSYLKVNAYMKGKWYGGVHYAPPVSFYEIQR